MKARLAISMLLCALALLIAADPVSRTVTGRVLSSDGELLKGAVVQIKDTRTLHIRSFITQADGGFHFGGLNPNSEYEVSAVYRERSSQTKVVSQFESAETVRLDLVIRNRRRP